ncbi:hypothetical protein GCM10011613_12660 [Cellvibrio zantedeschiae]|uniref:DUF2271 domain-containing protein n=1 Tax=Cellvibrio zantedeschiae TaxID=1237077 RepID=A0ABQ3AYG5_9GAMM|nr:DUF2271 domain-containing protein [Cellvibrio zantedeschiae]GGY69779.1 hypothetical protein GCM10011613_12660 [Cellvibrio zantedeschiae]
MLKKITLACALLLSPLTYAAGLQISVEIPKLNVTEYHTPYTAVWLESTAEGDKKFTKTLAVWYADKKREGGGEKWLKDLRQWWRRDGRNLTFPVDGVSGATKLAGVHQLSFTQGAAPLGTLPKGDYVLFVEVAREGGGREVVRVPFTWPVEKPTSFKESGSAEVGAVTLDLNP